MKYKIVYDKPGRIRFRCGQYAFDEQLEHAIELYILASEFVTSADVHYENGGILVCYKVGHRDEVVKKVSMLDTRKLTPVEPDEIDLIDRNFKKDITNILVRRFLTKAISPAALGNIIITIKGLKYVWRAIDTLGNGNLNVDVLDGASITACLAQRKFSTAGTIMFMLSISSLLENYTRAKTKAALTESLAIKTDKVWLVNGDTDVLVPMSQVSNGDVIRVRTGNIIPVDGMVVSGEANVNESSLTGEPLSVMRDVGSSVFAGTVIEEGTIAVKVRSIGSNTKIQKIIELIDNSENLKAGIQSRAENLADRIVPFSFLGFGLTLLFTRNVTKAVSILMVDYSCAIKLSTPISVISALREAANMDITVKGGKYLEEFAAADSLSVHYVSTIRHEMKQRKRSNFSKRLVSTI